MRVPSPILRGAAALALLLSASSPSLAQKPAALKGELYLAGKTPIDPPPEEPKNSHAYVTLTGPGALQMYRAMKAKAEPNLCEEGKTMKRAGPLMCSVSRDGRNASCDFSIDLLQGTLADGQPC